jgi:nuclear transport factor 2 (NTF2) superfamily protein
MPDRPPCPPFDQTSATLKVRLAEDGWNSRDPHRVAQAYTEDSWWRNRSTFLQGREAIVEFLTAKWQRELQYRLIKELWAFTDRRIAVRFCYEYHDPTGAWFRAYGNENWHFDSTGLMRWRHASINDVGITDSDRLFHWDQAGPRPDDHPGLTELGL